MKRTIAAAIIVGVGGSALGAGALDIKGSDTMRRFTQSLVNTNPEGGDVGNHCVGAFAGLQYIGGGSANGQTSMANRIQHIAMMSSSLASGLCGFTDGPTEPPLDTAEGIAFAKDGIAIVSATADGAGPAGADTRAVACDPDGACPGPAYPAAGTGLGPDMAQRACTVDTDCTGSTPAGTCVSNLCSIADDRAPGTWRWALRLIYFGLNSTDGSTAANRNCLDPDRIAILNNYGSLFDNACAPGGVDGTGQPCTFLRRAFRRDEAAGTTELFRIAVGAGTVPFCNVWRLGDPAPRCPPAKTATGDFAIPPYSENFQDNDPVRRPALGNGNSTNLFDPNANPNELPTEQVASIWGELGVVLPISIPPQITPATAPDYYPTTPCTGVTRTVQAPTIPGFPVGYGLCPDGTVPSGCNWSDGLGSCIGGPGVCRTNTLANGDPRCLHTGDRRPPRPPGKEFPGGACTPLGGIADGRVYNLHNWQNAGDPRPYLEHTYPIANHLANRQMVGSFFRIHATRVASTAVTRRTCNIDTDCAVAVSTCVDNLCTSDCDADADCATLGTNLVCASPGAAGRCVKEASCGAGFTEGPCCQRTSDTDQIGCLASVSECSVGFAGSSAKDVTQPVAGAVRAVSDISLNAVTADPACILDSTYPLGRDLFLSTSVGFENITNARFQDFITSQLERNAELELARCVSGSGALADTGGAGLNTLTAIFARYDLVPRTPTCLEFDETLCTGEMAGANACECTRIGTGYGPGRSCTLDANCSPFVATATCDTDNSTGVAIKRCSRECDADVDCTVAPYTTCRSGMCMSPSITTTTPAGIRNGAGVLCP